MVARALHLVLSVLVFSLIPVNVYAVSTASVDVYVTQIECPLCPGVRSRSLQYFGELKADLSDMGIVNVRMMRIDRDRSLAEDLNELYERLGVPDSMQGSMVVSVDQKFLFANYVSIEIISDFLANRLEDYERIAVLRDPLRGTYKVMDEEGRITECDMKTSVTECLGVPGDMPSSTPWSIVSLIAVSGLLDGINPCAFAVLLFFVTFLYGVGVARFPGQIGRRLVVFGSTYILAVYLTYLMIGITLRQTVAMIPFSHVVSRIFALVVIGTGIMYLKDYFRPNLGFSLKMSSFQWKTVRRWMRKTTIPAVFIVGVMVGLFEFPCTGGVYVAILGVLAATTTFREGLAYLLIYNLMFILPLIVILVTASNKKIIEFSLTKWQKYSDRRMRLLSSLFYVALGVSLFLSGSV